ncbi:MAG: hypothetical protein AAGA35_01980 [Patescibacteria group bacterium]
MLEQTAAWPWQLKSLASTIILAGFTVAMVWTAHRIPSFTAEKFLMSWYIGIVLAFTAFTWMSPQATVVGLFQPGWVFVVVVGLGLVFGGVANAWMAQSLAAAPNPGMVWAIIGANAPISYLALYWLGKKHPQGFPESDFGWINFVGVIVISVGLVMTMWPKAT